MRQERISRRILECSRVETELLRRKDKVRARDRLQERQLGDDEEHGGKKEEHCGSDETYVAAWSRQT